MPISLATVKQIKPSDTTVAGRTIDVDMNALSDSLVKARLQNQAKWGWPDSVVCTAATNETLFSEPWPAVPPWRSPPR